MTYFKPGTRVKLTKAYSIGNKNMCDNYKGILIVSNDIDDNIIGYKVYRSTGGTKWLPSDDYRFELADPIWLQQKDTK